MQVDLMKTALYAGAGDEVAILVSTTADFTSGTVYTGQYLGGGQLTVRGIDFVDGNYFTVAVMQPQVRASGVPKQVQKISDLTGGLVGLLSGVHNDGFGHSIENIGDLDGDGISDLAVGSLYHDPLVTLSTNDGAVWILFMNADMTVKSTNLITEGTSGFVTLLDGNDYFGSDITSIGDFNKDGVQDIAVSARLDDDGSADNGAVYLIYLTTAGGVVGYDKISSLDPNLTLLNADQFGRGLSSLGDLDGDGTVDLVVGERYGDEGVSDAGAIYIIFLNDDGTVKRSERLYYGSANIGFSPIADSF